MDNGRWHMVGFWASGLCGERTCGSKVPAEIGEWRPDRRDLVVGDVGGEVRGGQLPSGLGWHVRVVCQWRGLANRWARDDEK
jgi:hypothetical protein